MLISLLFLITSILLGFYLVRLIPMHLHRAELVFASLLVGLFSGSWLIFVCTWLTGYTVGPWLTIAILFGSCWYLHRKKHNLQPFLPLPGQKMWLITTILSTLILGQLFYTHMLSVKDGAYYSGGSAWGDLALHLSLITRFANETHFTWDLPILTGAHLSYPFLIDFLSGMLYRYGFSLQMAVLIPGLLLALCLVQLIFFLVVRLTKKASAAALTILLFLVGGSPGAITFFWKDWQQSGVAFSTFINDLAKQYSHVVEYGVFFSNIVCDYLLPQRGILFGLSLFALVVILLHQSWQEKNQKTQRTLLLAAALVTGFTPLAHTHTFLILFGLLSYLAVVQGIRQRRFLTPWLTTLVIACAIASPQMIWQLTSNFTSNFSHFQFGWMKGADESVLAFWLNNLGPAFIFMFANFWFIKKHQHHDSFHLHFYVPLIVAFLATNVYIFQPHIYDNMKFMVYSFLAVCIYMSWWLTTWNKTAFMKTCAIVVIIASTAVGFLSLWRERYSVWQFIGAPEVEAAEEFKKVVPPEALILTADQHTHFVPALTGRRIVRGYGGWLWTYGLDYAVINDDSLLMFSGAPQAAELFKKYHIDVVVIGPAERKDFSANQAYFDKNATLIMQSGVYRIYSVRQ